MERSEPPKVLNVADADRASYDKIRESAGPLKGREWRDIFMLCVSLGFQRGTKLPLDSTTKFLLRTESVLPAQRALANAVAVADTGRLEVIGDQKTVWSIAEEYANAGIGILKDQYLGDTEKVFLKELEAQLLQIGQVE